MKIEQSQLELSSRSFLLREQVRIRQDVETAPARAQAARVSVAAAPPVDVGEQLVGKELLMRLVAEMMLGKKVHAFRVSAAGVAVSIEAPAENAPQTRVRSVQVLAESEEVRFQAKGAVRTADGRRIDFEAELKLSREFVQIGAVDQVEMQDPLVLNFDGKGVRLLGDRVQFDFNGDGEAESAPVVAPGSGILFVDRNRDGVANDGSELFGARSGDGFRELGAQDADQNGWIDESDPVFGELRVWFQESDGPGAVYKLTDLGIGAISTASVGTQFDLRNARTGLLGQIRASGVYLQEDGQAGVVSHVDLSV